MAAKLQPYGRYCHRYSESSSDQPASEERQDLVARGNRGLAGFIDQVSGHDAVGARHHLVEERRRVGVGRRVGGAWGGEEVSGWSAASGSTRAMKRSPSVFE